MYVLSSYIVPCRDYFLAIFVFYPLTFISVFYPSISVLSSHLCTSTDPYYIVRSVCWRWYVRFVPWSVSILLIRVWSPRPRFIPWSVFYEQDKSEWNFFNLRLFKVILSFNIKISCTQDINTGKGISNMKILLLVNRTLYTSHIRIPTY